MLERIEAKASRSTRKVDVARARKTTSSPGRSCRRSQSDADTGESISAISRRWETLAAYRTPTSGRPRSPLNLARTLKTPAQDICSWLVSPPYLNRQSRTASNRNQSTWRQQTLDSLSILVNHARLSFLYFHVVFFVVYVVTDSHALIYYYNCILLWPSSWGQLAYNHSYRYIYIQQVGSRKVLFYIHFQLQ